MPWAKTGRWWVWEWLFSRYRWYRRWCGGHWEQWCNDATKTDMWFQMDSCSRHDGYRPPCCFGTPICEDHPPRGEAVPLPPKKPNEFEGIISLLNQIKYASPPPRTHPCA